MKRILIVLITLLILIGCSKNQCNKEESLCGYDVIEDFEIEDNALVKVGFYSEKFAKSFIEKIEETHPNLSGVYTYEIIDTNFLEIDDFDILQVRAEYVPLLFDKLEPLDDSFSSLLESSIINKFSKDINQSGNYFMPFDYEGLLFAYNKTMLESFNIDLKDSDNNGIADTIDSFEKINDLANGWRENNVLYNDDQLQSIFTFPLNDQMSMLTFFENSEYKFFNGSSAEDMDVLDNLYEALLTLQSLGQIPFYFDASLENDMVWSYENTLLHQDAPFLIVGNWMYYETLQKSQAYELVFSKFPSFNELEFSPLVNVSGFVSNKESEYKNVINVFNKLLKSEIGIAAALDSMIAPVVSIDYIFELNLETDKNLLQQIQAYSYSKLSDLHAFESNPKLKGFDIFYEVDFRDIFKDVFLNKLDIELAQKEFINKVIDWYSDNEIPTDKLEEALELIENKEE